MTKPRIQETCLPQAGRVVAIGDQECCGCVAKVHVLIRGDLSGMRSHYAKAPYVATCRVTGQKSAEAIVGVGSRHWRMAIGNEP